MRENDLTPATSNAQKIMEAAAGDVTQKSQFALGSGNPFVNRTLLITPPVAQALAEKYKSPNDFENALIATARRPFDERVYARYWASPGSSYDTKGLSIGKLRHKLTEQEQPQTTAVPAWLQWSGVKETETVPVMKKGMTAILVTGDESRNKIMTLSGGGTASVKIELPENGTN